MGLKHKKVNQITPWTQAQLDVIIAGGPAPLPPVGTTLNKITTTTDWNDDHVIDGDIDFMGFSILNLGSLRIGQPGAPRGLLDVVSPGYILPPTNASIGFTYDPPADGALQANGDTFGARIFSWKMVGAVKTFSVDYAEATGVVDNSGRDVGFTINYTPPASADGYRVFFLDPFLFGFDFSGNPGYIDVTASSTTYGMSPDSNENNCIAGGSIPPTPQATGINFTFNNTTGHIVGSQTFDNNLTVAADLAVQGSGYFGSGGIGGFQKNGSTVALAPPGKPGFVALDDTGGHGAFFGFDGGKLKMDNGDWVTFILSIAGAGTRSMIIAANPNLINNLTISEDTITHQFVHNIFNGDLTIADGKNFIFNTATGTKHGTATNQKQAFWNATPIIQPANTVALDTLLANLGLRASGGDALFDTNVKIGTLGKTLYIKEGSGGFQGFIAMVSGVASVTISGLTSADHANVTRAIVAGTLGTGGYKAVCSANTLTITSINTAGTTNTLDTSTFSYTITRPA